MTCAQIVADIKDKSSATVSSALKKMYDDNMVTRTKCGPRGGFGYKLTFLGVAFYLGVMSQKAFHNFSEALRSIVVQ